VPVTTRQARARGPLTPRRTQRCALLSACLLAVSGIAAGDSGLPIDISRSLRLHELSSEDLSLYLRAVDEPQPRIALNIGVARSPASTIKLLTTAATLDRLGPDYRWKTQALLGGPLAAGRLTGDLIIQGGGDPSIRTEQLWRFLWELRARGLVHIDGDILIDNAAFDLPPASRADFDGDGDNPYNALPVAFSINGQVTEVTAEIDPGSGDLRTWLAPPIAGMALIDGARVVAAPCTAKHHRLGLQVADGEPAHSVTLSGTFASKCGSDRLARLLLGPVDHAAGAILALWSQLGGTLAGEIREGETPQDATLFHTLESEPLAQVVRDVNKRSDNLMARTLLLTLGMEDQGRPATVEKGREALIDWLDSQGLELPGLVIDNGSGLSRETRISAEGLAQVLGWAYAHPEMAELIASLPIVGVDGTLARRLRRSPVQGQGHIKTGTLRGVTAMAGFVVDATGTRWILVSLINNPRLQHWRGKAVEDAILLWAYHQQPKS
jgi:D-alanyl-D-alanine carboxypeptidase/D-alanyl-D-alanine-endopeptidase (penicillin-binding protein 4)